MARLRHPNIVAVYAAGEADGLLYFVMEYVEGESLRQMGEREGRAEGDRIASSVTLLADLARALGYAHAQGVVHRDVKPENVLLDAATGRAMLTDFGVARAFASGNDSDADSAVTRTGFVVGSPRYMSPEQAVGERELDGRSDIYSLGLVAYEIFAGSAPFTGSSPMAVLTKQLTEAPPPLAQRRPDLPAEITGAIDRALSKQPRDRWATAEEFARAISGASASDPNFAAAVPSPSSIPAARVSTVVTPAAVPSAPRARWRWAAMAAAVRRDHRGRRDVLAAPGRNTARGGSQEVVPRRAIRDPRWRRSARLAPRGEREHAHARPLAVVGPERRQLRARARSAPRVEVGHRATHRPGRCALDGAARRSMDGRHGAGDCRRRLAARHGAAVRRRDGPAGASGAAGRRAHLRSTSAVRRADAPAPRRRRRAVHRVARSPDRDDDRVGGGLSRVPRGNARNEPVAVGSRRLPVRPRHGARFELRAGVLSPRDGTGLASGRRLAPSLARVARGLAREPAAAQGAGARARLRRPHACSHE